MRTASRRAQGGLAAVEFAVVGSAAITVLIGCIEIGRLFFVWNAIAESTRVGARVAAVSSLAAAQAAAVTYSAHLPGLTTGNVTVNYYTETGAAATGPGDATTAFVSVGITGYTHTLLIPGLGTTLTVPSFTTTLPAESLGIDPD
jgi:hypothetical protein